jgi:hypothetical protein
MNEIDRENLRFILETQGPALELWYSHLSPAQRIYASNLLNTYRQELNLRTILMQDPFIASLTEANILLDKFKLGL